ncbi:imm11 family protein [Sphingobium sp.]|uniref:imm11 family protein n=1 Tax=Sphingobium sp. TaxID=1912891 RepID=UPI003BB507E7
MVWGMNLPRAFGEFWPDGDFEGTDASGADGWTMRLKAYYQDNMPTDQKVLFDDGQGNGPLRYPYFVSQKFTNEPGALTGREPRHLSPIESQEPPQSFDIARGSKSLGSLIKLNNRILAVDEPLRTIIERLDPQVHQFFPIMIKLRKGNTPPSKYYTLVIGKYIDSFLPENSTSDAYRSNGENQFIHEETKKAMSGLAFSKALFGGAHLWRERRLSAEWLTCFSDELEAEIANAGLRIPKHFRMKEV